LKFLSTLGNAVYFLSYPFWWVIGLPNFIVLAIGKNPIFSLILAMVFWYAHILGFRSVIPIPYSNISIETGEENAILYLIIALVVMPFFAQKVYDSLFHRGLWAFIKDPLNLRKNKQKHRAKKPPKVQPVKIIVPSVKPDSISHAVTRLPPHLQRLISGVNKAGNN